MRQERSRNEQCVDDTGADMGARRAQGASSGTEGSGLAGCGPLSQAGSSNSLQCHSFWWWCLFIGNPLC